MKKNIFNNTLVAGAITLAIAGCSDVENGTDYGFESSQAVVYSADAFTLSLTEETGEQIIDLLEGASVGGVALNVDTFGSPIFIREFEFAATDEAFITPQIEGNARNQTISPFSLDETGTKLVVNTDQFADALRMCDATDNRGGPQVDGAPTSDGVRDFPTTVTYNISYIVDVGHELAPGEEVEKRTLTLTIDAVNDPVTGVIAADVELPAGGTAQATASTVPYYACDKSLTFSVEHTDTATVDANGELTGTGTGVTTFTATSVDNPDVSATANVTVTAAFSIAIANDDKDELGTSTGTKLVPSCVNSGVEVQPSVINHTLNGSYGYDWTSSNADFAFVESGAAGFGATGMFTAPDTAGQSTTVDVAISSGDTGATAIADIAGKSVTLTTERNYACDPNANANGDVWYASDLLMESGGWGPDATHVAEGLDGNALQFTIPAGGQIRAAATQQQWNQVFNFHAAHYARGDASIGRQFKFAVWAKLKQLPADPAAELKIDHTILAWNCDGCDGLANFPARYDAGVTQSQSAVLKHTTDWQLVELINPLTGTAIWEVPAHFNVPSAAFQFWDFYGFAEGDQILLDHYSIVEVE